MIDIHSHILPGVDDGAQTLDTALSMLQLSQAQGVTVQYLTPHMHARRFPNTKSKLQSQFNRFSRQAQEAGIDVELRLGAELRIGPEIMQWLAQDEVPFLGKIDGMDAFLLEFPTNEVPFGSDNIVHWCIQRNRLPIIVHPERNQVFMKRPDKLDPFIAMGCPLQITAGSLLGKFGEKSQKIAQQLLDEGNVFAVASDAHNLKGRAPDLGDLPMAIPDVKITPYAQKTPVLSSI